LVVRSALVGCGFNHKVAPKTMFASPSRNAPSMKRWCGLAEIDEYLGLGEPAPAEASALRETPSGQGHWNLRFSKLMALILL
jgi:hypothetical protein